MGLRDDLTANIIGSLVDRFLAGELVVLKMYRELASGNITLTTKQIEDSDVKITIASEHI